MATVEVKLEPGFERLTRLKLVKRVRGGKWRAVLLRPNGETICAVYVRAEDMS